MSMTVRASDFSRNFARYQDEAMTEKVIAVTSHGRIVGAYISAAELARYERLKARERDVLSIDTLDDGTLAAIEQAEYGAEPK